MRIIGTRKPFFPVFYRVLQVFGIALASEVIEVYFFSALHAILTVFGTVRSAPALRRALPARVLKNGESSSLCFHFFASQLQH